MKATAALVATLTLLLVAVTASAAPGGAAKVRSVSVPRSATAGAPVDVKVRTAGKARKRAAKAAFYLSADSKRDAGDVRLKVAAGQPLIPEGQAPGSYRVIACIRKSCRASRPLQVTKTPVGTRQLVDQAVAAGKLSPGQGLVYRVFSAFGDGRLPAAYAGDDTAQEDTIMRDVAESWGQLSAKQRAQVQPFFTPPAAKGSWASAGAARATAAGTAPACGTSRFAARGWTSIARKDGHVRIWWRVADRDRFAARARVLLDEAEDSIWRKLWDVFGRDALSDDGESCFHGPDGKLDVYLTRTGEGRAQAKATTVNYPGACSGTPSYIVFNAGGSAPTRWELAHELTHAFQFAFPVMGCSSWDNFDEAVATWGGQYIYPRDDQEHRYVWFTKEPDTPLADASYDGWVFPYALEQLVGPGVIQRIYEQGATHQAMNAIDAGVPGGLAKVYPEFAKLAWNHDPVKPSFWEWDGFDPVPEDANGAEIAPEQVDLGTAGQKEVDLTQPLKPLSRAYKHLKFGAGVRDVMVQVPYDADLHVEALLKLRDGTSKTVDLTKRRGPVFCPETASEQVAEMVLVASDTSTFRQMAQDKPIRVLANNLGCSKYVGSGSGVEHTHYGARNTTESWTVSNLVFQRQFTGDDSSVFQFKLMGGTVNWTYSGTFDGCTVAGAYTFQLPQGNQSGGSLDIDPLAGQNLARRYTLSSPVVPIVPITAVCQDGMRTWNFQPHRVLETWNEPTRLFDVPGNGIIDGTNSGDEATGGARDVSYTWHLEPQP